MRELMLIESALSDIGILLFQKEYGQQVSLDDSCEGTRLRFDIELSAPFVEVHDRIDTLNAILREVAVDLEVLLTDGDIESSDSDVLLKTMDGAKKRNQKPVHISIPRAVCYEVYSWVKDAYEYTVFLILRVEWE